MKNLFKTNGMKTGATKTGLKNLLAAALLAVSCTGVYHTASAQATVKEKVVVSAPAILDADNSNTRINADFPGGISKFYSYVSAQLKPDSTCSPGKKVYVMFMIDKEGKLKRAKVQGHLLSDKMNDQIVKIFENTPQWTPAIQNGHEVKEHFICPVSFMPKTDLMAKVDLPKKQ